MGKAARREKGKTGAVKVPDHLALDSFKAFQGYEIASIDDLSDFMEKFTFIFPERIAVKQAVPVRLDRSRKYRACLN